jgi:hypothetical protein
VALAGVLAGLTVATKFSGLLVIVILLATYFTHRLVVKPPVPLRLRRVAIAVVVLPALVTWATYFLTARSIAADPKIGDANDHGILNTIVHIPIPAYYYFRGVHMLHRYTYVSHPSYFLGSMWNYGSRWYFPVAFLVKSPICLLALLVLALARFERKDRRKLWITTSILGAAILYFAVTTNSPLNLGVRHILPVYALLFLFIASALSTSRVALLLLAGVVVESTFAYPNYLGFFNFAAGGATAAPRYLLDSNVDWGQDLKRLGLWMRQDNVDNVCLSYFGTADPAYYGISYQPLEPGRDCVRAVSVQHLFTKSEPVFRDLAATKPDLILGTSIYVFRSGAH